MSWTFCDVRLYSDMTFFPYLWVHIFFFEHFLEVKPRSRVTLRSGQYTAALCMLT